MIAGVFLMLLGGYLACGLMFAFPFALAGVETMDPHAKHASWGFRVLIVPGAMALWPLLLRRWARGVHELPEESNAHRRAARPSPGVHNPNAR
jgi:hypothetical protein